MICINHINNAFITCFLIGQYSFKLAFLLVFKLTILYQLYIQKILYLYVRMKNSQQGTNLSSLNKSQLDFQYIIDIFKESAQLCYQHICAIYNQNQGNLLIEQIKSDCQALKGDYQLALKGYQKCSIIKPNLAYYNNMAWVHMKKRQYKLALDYLNNIKDKWNHPAIYWNLALAYERTNQQDTQLIMNCMEKRDQYSILYPDFQRYQGLIHNFLFVQAKFQNKIDKQNKQLKEQIASYVKSLRNHRIQMINYQEFSTSLQSLFQKLNSQSNRPIKLQEKQKIHIQVLVKFKQLILQKIFPCQKIDYVVKRLLTKSVGQINQVLYRDFTINFNSENFNKIIIPLMNSQLQKISIQILQRKQVLKDNLQIINQENDKIKYSRPEPDVFQYQFRNRLEDFDQMQKMYKATCCLKVEKNSQLPLLKIACLNNENLNTVLAYRNFANIKSKKFNLSTQLKAQLNNLNEKQRKMMQTYYQVINLLLHFYNYYATGDFEYTKDQFADFQLNDFINMITPLLPQISNSHNIDIENIGFICNQVHFGLIKYLRQTSKNTKHEKKLVSTLLQRVISLFGVCESPGNSILIQISNPKNHKYLQSLTNQSALTKQSRYFHYKMNFNHIIHPQLYADIKFQQEDQIVITNAIIFLLTFGINNTFNKNNLVNSLVDALVDAFYSSKETTSFANHIYKTFYQANHDIKLLDKIKQKAINIFSKILPI